MRNPRGIFAAIRFAGLLLALGLAPSGRAEVILQYFESDWNEIYQRIPEIAEAGYDALWTPPPCKSPEAGAIIGSARR